MEEVNILREKFDYAYDLSINTIRSIANFLNELATCTEDGIDEIKSLFQIELYQMTFDTKNILKIAERFRTNDPIDRLAFENSVNASKDCIEQGIRLCELITPICTVMINKDIAIDGMDDMLKAMSGFYAALDELGL